MAISVTPLTKCLAAVFARVRAYLLVHAHVVLRVAQFFEHLVTFKAVDLLVVTVRLFVKYLFDNKALVMLGDSSHAILAAFFIAGSSASV